MTESGTDGNRLLSFPERSEWCEASHKAGGDSPLSGQPSAWPRPVKHGVRMGGLGDPTKADCVFRLGGPSFAHTSFLYGTLLYGQYGIRSVNLFYSSCARLIPLAMPRLQSIGTSKCPRLGARGSNSRHASRTLLHLQNSRGRLGEVSFPSLSIHLRGAKRF
jgi:hypothetical protein